MKSLIAFIFARARVIVFFIWVYALIELLQGGRYLTFLRPEFGYVLGAALAMFLAVMIAEMGREPGDRLHWSAFQRPLILLIPLLFLLNAQGASLDYYTFNKRFTGTAGMAVNVEPSDDSDVPAGGRAAVDNGQAGEAGTVSADDADVPSSLNPSKTDRIRFSRKWNQDGTPGNDSDTPSTGSGTDVEAGSQPSQPPPHEPGTLPEDQRPKGDNDDEADDDGTPDVIETALTSLYETPKLFEGKQVSVIGMVDTNEDIARQFGDRAKVLFRFLISCCAADAQPIALIFETKQQTTIKGENVWVRVSGKFTLHKKDGRTIPVIREASLSTVPRPANEYLY